MGDAETVLEVIGKARHELQKAQDVADNTPRPPNACGAHDSQFALTKALTGGVDTLLMIAGENRREREQGIPSAGKKACTFLEYLTRPWPCVFFSFAVFSPNLPLILETAKGFMHK